MNVAVSKHLYIAALHAMGELDAYLNVEANTSVEPRCVRSTQRKVLTRASIFIEENLEFPKFLKKHWLVLMTIARLCTDNKKLFSNGNVG